jgi:hypothetical protein
LKCASFHHTEGEGNNIADYLAKQCTDKDTEFLAMFLEFCFRLFIPATLCWLVFIIKNKNYFRKKKITIMIGVKV